MLVSPFLPPPILRIYGGQLVSWVVWVSAAPVVTCKVGSDEVCPKTTVFFADMPQNRREDEPQKQLVFFPGNANCRADGRPSISPHLRFGKKERREEENLPLMQAGATDFQPWRGKFEKELGFPPPQKIKKHQLLVFLRLCCF